MANETTLSTMGTTVPTENIHEYIQQARLAPSLMGTIAWVENIAPGSGGVHRWQRFAPISVNAGTKTEATASFANAAVTTQEESATAGVVGVAMDMSREVQYDSLAGLPTGAINEGLRAMQARLETDALSVITGATSTIGAVANTLTMANFAAGLAGFELTNPPDSEVVCVMAPFQWQDLLANAVSLGSAVFSSVNVQDIPGGVPGFKTKLLNCSIYVSSAVATETTGRNAVITSPGRFRSGLGIAVWQPVQAELDPAPIRYSDVYVLSARYGCSLTMNQSSTQTNVTELISRAS
jgi:hypothetical protein